MSNPYPQEERVNSQAEQTNEALEIQENEVKSEKIGLDFPVIKIQLPREAALKVQSTLRVLKERKAEIKADELISEFLNSISAEYLDDQIEKRTPQDYYFEAARNIPELRDKIIQQAKKALQRNDRSFVKAIPTEPRKRKAKEKLQVVADEVQVANVI
jgi:hypothetical protein